MPEDFDGPSPYRLKGVTRPRRDRRTERVIIAIGLVIVLLCIWYGVDKHFYGIPEVTVVNDLGGDAALLGCDAPNDFIPEFATGPRIISARERMRIRPHSPCKVYRGWPTSGSYEGCLTFPDSAFTESEIIVISEQLQAMSRRSCDDAGDYRGFRRGRFARTSPVPLLPRLLRW